MGYNNYNKEKNQNSRVNNFNQLVDLGQCFGLAHNQLIKNDNSYSIKDFDDQLFKLTKKIFTVKIKLKNELLKKGL
jgi:hypothetical protein